MQQATVELVEANDKDEMLEKDYMPSSPKKRPKGGDWSGPRRSRIEGNEINAADRQISYEHLATKN